jgi:alpha-ketoglutarate-dependent dioxygenase FTO
MVKSNKNRNGESNKRRRGQQEQEKSRAQSEEHKKARGVGNKQQPTASYHEVENHSNSSKAFMINNKRPATGSISSHRVDHNRGGDALLLPLPFPEQDNQDTMMVLPKNTFLRNEAPFTEAFQCALDTSYEGFACDVDIDIDIDEPNANKRSRARGGDNKSNISSNRNGATSTIFPHAQIRDALTDMDTDGYFRTDVTQPFGLGTKCAKTYVTRCLVGDPGTTYKYLGLRMFAHPWTNTTTHHAASAHSALDTIAELNQTLTRRSNLKLQQLTATRRGRCTTGNNIRHDIERLESSEAGFDITLINKMTPSQEFKKEPVYEQDTCSVSWHADSSLEHYSTIAVYHTLFHDYASTAETVNTNSRPHKNKKQQPQQQSKNSAITNHSQWSVGLRVVPNAEGPHATNNRGDLSSAVNDKTPPIAVSLPSGSAYYLLDDFNHHHQHAVLNNNSSASVLPVVTTRYSSTHRKLREGHTVQFMLSKCRVAIDFNFHRKGLKVWRAEQLLLTEIECEWLRQFFVQGQGHKDQLWNTWWQDPLKKLFRYWSQLEARTLQVLQTLKLAAEARFHQPHATHQKDAPGAINKAERKRQDKRKKALVAIEGILARSTNSDDDDATAVNDLYGTMADLLEERALKREHWHDREHDVVFHRMPASCRPLAFPVQYDYHESKMDNANHENEGSTGTNTMALTADAADVVLGHSPMTSGTGPYLRQLATHVRAWATAFQNKDSSALPKRCLLPTMPTIQSSGNTTVSSTDNSLHGTAQAAVVNMPQVGVEQSNKIRNEESLLLLAADNKESPVDHNSKKKQGSHSMKRQRHPPPNTSSKQCPAETNPGGSSSSATKSKTKTRDRKKKRRF